MEAKIAYMVLAHHQPEQLARLVARLDQPDAYFFIHFDKKSPFKDKVEDLVKATNPVVVRCDHEVNWMGYTTIEAEITLMESAVAAGVPFKYYVLLSGQDYPIKSNAFINDFFSAHNEDFLSYNKITHLGGDYMLKHTRYHFRDIPYINPRNPKKIPALVYLYFGLHRCFAKFFPKKEFYRGMELYFGSQWFALRHETISYILQFLKENKGYIDDMRYTDGPDELFFHTIIMNSDRRHNVYGYERYVEWQNKRKKGDKYSPLYSSLRYMDWSPHLKSKPAVLDMTYWDALKNSQDLFARKVDQVASAELMDELDKRILNFIA